uniref:NodB homology domain-containing protein n=1 Tax=Caldisericum exile TaxID=693075 RepID=A0A7C4Y625_9BACT
MGKSTQNIELIISVDDSHPLNYKSAELLKKYDLVKNTIFFLDTARMEAEQLEYLLEQGFEIGNHTKNHKILTEIPIEEVKEEILAPEKNLPFKWFCYPRGRYNQEIIKVLKELGYKRARTTKVFQILTPKNPLESHSTIHCYQRKEYGDTDWEIVAKKYWDKVKQGKGNYYHLWWHSWEIERYQGWIKLERVLGYIKEAL